MGSIRIQKFLAMLFFSLTVITWSLSEKAVYITVTPTTLTLSHAMTSSGGNVTVRCTGTPGDTTLYSLKLSRVMSLYPNSTPTTLLSVLQFNQEPQVIYPIEGSKASGRVTQNFLTLQMSRVKCEDAGVYTCEAAYLGNSLSTVTVNETLSVEVKPGYLTVSAEPDYKNWAVNQTVTLTCAGPLGTVTLDTQIVWHWEYWDSSEDKWRADGSASDITMQRTNQQPCYQNGSSKLIRRLRLAVSKRVYRCYVERDGVSYPQFAGHYEFGHVVAIPDTTETETYDDGVVFGASLGVGITIAVVILVVVIVIMCLWSNRVICPDGEAEDSVSTEAEEDSSETRRKTKLNTRARNVALQTNIIGDDSYDVMDNGGADYYKSLRKLRGAPPSPPLHPHPVAHHGAANSSVSSDGPFSSKLFYARGEEEGEEGNDPPGSMIDLASAQQQQAAAEDMLRVLLSTRHVLSWRVNGDGGYITFLLHLSPSVHDPPFQGGVQQGRWRKKSAAAIAATGAQQQRRGGILVALPEVSGGYHYNSPRR
ncbi:hypothetical protein ACOMHN_033459 [Nucella lapillus]